MLSIDQKLGNLPFSQILSPRTLFCLNEKTRKISWQNEINIGEGVSFSPCTHGQHFCLLLQMWHSSHNLLLFTVGCNINSAVDCGLTIKLKHKMLAAKIKCENGEGVVFSSCTHGHYFFCHCGWGIQPVPSDCVYGLRFL
jgi:hypothetical protein